MKKLVYYLAIVATFIVVWLIGAFICAALKIAGAFPMLIIAGASFAAARLTAALLKDIFNPTPPKAE